jgi:hypothetical protein
VCYRAIDAALVTAVATAAAAAAGVGGITVLIAAAAAAAGGAFSLPAVVRHFGHFGGTRNDGFGGVPTAEGAPLDLAHGGEMLPLKGS